MDKITWDDSYAIALALKSKFPNIQLENVTLNDIFHWTINLPDFEDDPDIINDGILMNIYTEWLEEVNPL